MPAWRGPGHGDGSRPLATSFFLGILKVMMGKTATKKKTSNRLFLHRLFEGNRAFQTAAKSLKGTFPMCELENKLNENDY